MVGLRVWLPDVAWLPLCVWVVVDMGLGDPDPVGVTRWLPVCVCDGEAVGVAVTVCDID